jgi:hypothetical protein
MCKTSELDARFAVGALLRFKPRKDMSTYMGCIVPPEWLEPPVEGTHRVTTHCLHGMTGHNLGPLAIFLGPVRCSQNQSLSEHDALYAFWDVLGGYAFVVTDRSLIARSYEHSSSS